jgi:hypothetical protein
MKYVFAASTCAVEWSPRPVRLKAGEAWDASDPFVKANPQHFVAEPSKPRRTVAPSPVVEQATKAPGERRLVIRD